MRDCISVFILSCLVTVTFGQTLTLDIADSPSTNTTIVLPVIATGFEDIVGIQTTIEWDPGLLLLESITDFSVANMSEGNFGLSNIGSGYITLVWIDTSVAGVSLTDGSVLFELNFTIINDIVDSTVVCFNTAADAPTSTEVSQLSDGDFIIIEDNFSCGSVNAEQPLAILDSQISSVTCFGSMNGSLDIEISGGTAPYQITWSGPIDNLPDSMNLTGLDSGTYFVTITDAEQETFETNFEISSPTQLGIEFMLPNLTCQDSTATVEFSPFGGVPPFSYSLNNVASENPTYENLSPNSYELIVTDSNECMFDTSFILNPVLPISVNISGNNILCEGSIDTLSVSSNYENILWSLDGETLMDQTAILVIDTPGTYSVLVTDENNCTAYNEFEVNFPNELDLFSTDNINICPNVEELLEVSANFDSYQWSLNGEILSNENDHFLTDLNLGVYVVEATLGNCNFEDSIMVTTITTPEINLESNYSICPNESFAIEVDSSFQAVQWFQDGILLSNENTIIVSEAAIYNVSVQIADCIFSDTTEVFELFSGIELSLGPDTSFCENEVLELATNTDLTNIEWYYNNTIVLNETASSLMIDQPGDYVISGINDSGCNTTAEISVAELPVILPELGDNLNFCAADSVTLSIENNYETYRWFLNDQLVLNETTNELTADSDGTIIVEAMQANACVVSDTIQLTYFEVQPIELVQDTFLCDGDTITISINDDYQQVNWSTGSQGTTTSLNAPQNLSNTINETILVTAIDLNNCQIQESLSIAYIAQVTAIISEIPDIICIEDTVQIVASGGGNYYWPYYNSIEPGIIFSPEQAGVVVQQVFVSDQYGCSTDSVSIDLFTPEKEVGTMPDTCITKGVSIQLIAFDGVAYEWQETEYLVSDIDIANPFSSPLDSTYYIVKIEDELECIYFDTIYVAVADDPLSFITPVNIITPNGDGKNDILQFDSIDKYPNNQLRIFNRWGMEVFSRYNYKNSFDGSYKNKPLPSGEYYYILSINESVIKSNLTILRE